jgi:hypothetical protein
MSEVATPSQVGLVVLVLLWSGFCEDIGPSRKERWYQ